MHVLETKLPAPVVALLLGAAMKWFAMTHPGIVDPTNLRGWRASGWRSSAG